MNLRRWLFENRMTLTLFAKKIGVTRWTVHNWKNGRNTPTSTHMEAIRSLTGGKITKEEDLNDGF
jgi:DNA-binding transcriptional regulator YiaG